MSGVKGKSGGKRKGAGAKQDLCPVGKTVFFTNADTVMSLTVLRRKKRYAVLADEGGREWVLSLGDEKKN